jgi:predicted nucleic acid-binding protein
MAHLVDTSVLARLANLRDPLYGAADNAIVELHRQGEVLYVTPQCLIEFRNVATRPVSANGLGKLPADADALVARFESRFPLLPETADIFPAWKAIVQAADVIGKQVHDARLVAVCQVHAVDHVLTFNVSHFTRLAAHCPGLAIVDPRTV